MFDKLDLRVSICDDGQGDSDYPVEVELDELSQRTDEQQSSIGTVAELFAGVGGFRLGLGRAGWETVFSNQWEPSTKRQHASECYVHNFGSDGHTAEDIAAVVDSHLANPEGGIIPRADLLVGGFPCQDYSVAKSLSQAHGLEGKKGVLWWEIHRIIEANRPPMVLLENVDRLLKSPAAQRGRDFAVMLASLSDLGYFIEWRVVNAADYGFPQRRRRVFIVGLRNDLFESPDAGDLGGFVSRRSTLARALPVEALSDAESGYTFEVAGELDKLSAAFNVGAGRPSPFANAGVIVGRSVFTVNLEPQFSGPRLTLGDVLVPDEQVPASFWVEDDALPAWKYLKGPKKIERTHVASGTPYVYSEGGMGFPDSLEAPARTILTAEGGSTPSRFKHLIQVAGGRHRRLTPVELERLNGFPDDWTKRLANGAEASDAKRAFFMGNALVVGIVERIGEVLAMEWSALDGKG